MPRPVLILYTDSAEIEHETLAAMRDAGYLPVKVRDSDAVRVMDIPLATAADDMTPITKAALQAILAAPIDAAGVSSVRSRFGGALAQLLLEDRRPKENDDAG